MLVSTAAGARTSVAWHDLYVTDSPGAVTEVWAAEQTERGKQEIPHLCERQNYSCARKKKNKINSPQATQIFPGCVSWNTTFSRERGKSSGELKQHDVLF